MKPNLVANKACAARVRKREQEMLKSRIKNVKPQIDTRPPDSMALDHVRNNLKREQLLEERYHAIDRDNRILLQKMSDIMKTPSVKSGLGAQSSPAINTRDARKAELSRITQENLAILKRIQQAQPVYNHVEWDDSYRRSLTYLKNSCEYPLTLTKKKVPTRSSSLTPLSGKANKGMATTTGSLGALAPGEVGQESAGDDLRYVLKEGKDINGVFYLCEMATDGRSLAITAYDAEQKTTLELLVNETNHRRLYRDHNGDYRAIAAKLCLDGEQLYIHHDGMMPDGKPERAA